MLSLYHSFKTAPKHILYVVFAKHYLADKYIDI